jgi:hypothetical protein
MLLASNDSTPDHATVVTFVRTVQVDEKRAPRAAHQTAAHTANQALRRAAKRIAQIHAILPLPEASPLLRVASFARDSLTHVAQIKDNSDVLHPVVQRLQTYDFVAIA